MKLYITYGGAYDQRMNYSVIEGETYAECLSKAHELTDGKFAFTYTEEEFAGQVEEYGLTEIPPQPQTGGY